jgi:sporulation protein YlmC with PRC-barrel domain
MYRICGCTLGLVLCVSGLAVGQQVTAEQPAPSTGMRRVSQILGSTVQLNDGRGYGKVEDIVLGPDNQVEYLVVSHQSQYAMLPWTAGEFDPAERVVTYGVAPQVIQPLLFAPNAWPRTNDPGFIRRTQSVFPQVAGRAAQPIRRRAARPVPGTAPVEGAPGTERPRIERRPAQPGRNAPPAPGAAGVPDDRTNVAVPPSEKPKAKPNGEAKKKP